MTKSDKFGKHLTIVLIEMCKRAGKEFDTMDWDDPSWHSTAEWTEKEQDDYESWLTDYVFTNAEARRELTTIGTKNKAQCKRFAELFVFNYGWRFRK